jgi:3-hydroxyisobutyrate dehydrogenase-like beta-hydroxyacid dehydrogenase
MHEHIDGSILCGNLLHRYFLLSSHFTRTACLPHVLLAAENSDPSSIDSFCSGRIWFLKFYVTQQLSNSKEQAMDQKIGMIGVGIMGSAMSANLLEAGYTVIGYDVVQAQLDALVRKGASRADSCRDVAEQADVVITSLPSVEALQQVVNAEDGLVSAGRKELIVIETSTLPLEAKQAAHDALKNIGVEMLDCPLSGTGAQAVKKDIVVYASGNRKACEDCDSIFNGFSRANYYVGEFGMGSKMKFVANLLVTIHNVSAAEAFVLGMKAGLDPEMILQAVSDGGGTSRMFEVRGPLMAAGKFDTATMKVDMHQKDIDIISDFAKKLNCPTPLHPAAVRSGADIYCGVSQWLCQTRYGFGVCRAGRNGGH